MFGFKMFMAIAVFSVTGFTSEARGLRPLFPPAEAYPTAAGCMGARDLANMSDDCTAYRLRLSRLGAVCVPAGPSMAARDLCSTNGVAAYARNDTMCDGRTRYLTCARNAARVAATN